MENAESHPNQICGELASHPMFRRVLDLVVPILKNDNETSAHSAANSYCLNVFDTAGTLIQTFDSLERCKNFATLVPSVKYLQTLNINRHDWLEYHASVFLIIFVTVGDESLSLVNSVFCLGIDPKHCRADILKSNIWVKDTAIPKCLDSIEKIIKPHRNPRNLFAHRGKTPSLDALCKSDKLDDLKRVSFVLHHKPEEFQDLSTKLDNAYVEAFSILAETLDNEILQLKSSVWELLNILHQFYSQRLSISCDAALSGKPAN